MPQICCKRNFVEIVFLDPKILIKSKTVKQTNLGKTFEPMTKNCIQFSLEKKAKSFNEIKKTQHNLKYYCLI